MDENERKEARKSRRKHHIEICGYQRAMAGLLAVSVVTNGVMYGTMRRTYEKHAAELDKLQSELQYAERVKDLALEQYGGLLLEMQRYSREKDQERKQTHEEPAYDYVGKCKITYYCCEEYPHICGNGDGLTATGTQVEPGIVAVDPDVIELGSTVIIEGTEYLAADTGGAIKGMRVDVCVNDHEEALELGTHTADVWIVR